VDVNRAQLDAGM